MNPEGSHMIGCQGARNLYAAAGPADRFSMRMLGDHMRKLLTAVILVIAMQLLVTPASAEMYKWVDKNGVIHYSDTPPAMPEEDVETMETTQHTPPSPKSDSAKSKATGKEKPNSEPKKTERTKKNILDQYADKVVIFTKSWCPHCKKAVAFLQSKRIRFEQ